ncbi:MAG: cupredoxin domain-containing protein [Rhodomicrobium sp.]
MGIAAALCVCFAAPPARAADEPVFEIEMKDGVIIPSRLEVPAKTRFKILVKNTGKIPAEFESAELRKEVVVPAGRTATMIIRTLDPGEYKFFDDFQPGAPAAVLIAK